MLQVTLPVIGRCAEELCVRPCAFQVKVCRVLPGKGYAAVHLDTVGAGFDKCIRAGEGARQNPARGARAQEALLALAESGALTPHISHRFDLEDAAAAFRAIDARAVIGKAVLADT